VIKRGGDAGREVATQQPAGAREIVGEEAMQQPTSTREVQREERDGVATREGRCTARGCMGSTTKGDAA